MFLRNADVCTHDNVLRDANHQYRLLSLDINAVWEGGANVEAVAFYCRGLLRISISKSHLWMSDTENL